MGARERYLLKVRYTLASGEQDVPLDAVEGTSIETNGHFLVEERIMRHLKRR